MEIGDVGAALAAKARITPTGNPESPVDVQVTWLARGVIEAECQPDEGQPSPIANQPEATTPNKTGGEQAKAGGGGEQPTPTDSDLSSPDTSPAGEKQGSWFGWLSSAPAASDDAPAALPPRKLFE